VARSGHQETVNMSPKYRTTKPRSKSTLPAAARKPRELESDIQRAICDYLALKHYFFWRQNTAALFREGRYFSMPKHSLRGVPDIILIKNGRFIGIEVKRPGGKLSDHQIDFQRMCIKNGAEYIIATSVEDVIRVGI